jgi:hypothetical protein
LIEGSLSLDLRTAEEEKPKNKYNPFHRALPNNARTGMKIGHLCDGRQAKRQKARDRCIHGGLLLLKSGSVLLWILNSADFESAI